MGEEQAAGVALGGAETAARAESAAAMDGGNYEVIRSRLVAHGATLRAKATALNTERTALFGASRLEVVANARVRTEHNCLPADLVQVQGCLLLGYNVYLGLKREVTVGDVFSLQRIRGATSDGVADVEPVAADAPEGAFLRDPGFVRDFTDLYKYYRETRLQQLRAQPERLLAVFRYGPSPRDLRVFYWNVLPDGTLAYIDNRGERFHTYPPQHDFEWTATTREDHVDGRHPHVSIADAVFVETVGGDLTIKVEDNTEDGQGIYREPVDDPNQTLDDARIEYARVGALILLRVRPYNEEQWRHFVFNRRTKTVLRIDAIGASCQSLPEEHGIVFPGGTVLQTGDSKLFDIAGDQLAFKRVFRSPNGEDVLYVYRDEQQGAYVLLPYNLIRKEVDNTIRCNGFSLFPDGRLIVFRRENGEATKVHPMQVWQTAFTSVEQAVANAVDSEHKLARIGNAEIVRGISDALTLCRLIDESQPTREVYEALIQSARRIADNVYWLADPEVGNLKETIDAIRSTAELVIDEFEKVVALRARAVTLVRDAERAHALLMTDVRADVLNSVDGFMEGLGRLRTHRGQLITLRDVRYVDAAKLAALEAEVVARFDEVTAACVAFLLDPAALHDTAATLESALVALDGVTATRELQPIATSLDATGNGLELLSEIIANLQVEDPMQRTQILESIGTVYALLNRARARAAQVKEGLQVTEGRAEFGAQFALFAQSVSSAIAVADTPERCDEQLSRLLLTLEELEGRFGEFDGFLADLAAKRDEVYDAFEAKKQTLVDARQRRVENLMSAADRMLQGIQRRATTLEGADALNAYFAADGLVMKLRDVAEQLVALGDTVKADELASRLKRLQQDAMRGLRDRTELFEEGGDVIRLGKHAFRVQRQALELTMVPRDGEMRLHVTGTDYYAEVSDPTFEATRPMWSQALVSETPEVYRAEYLAATLWFDALRAPDGLSRLQALHRDSAAWDAFVRDAAAERYDEGYDRGVHDADASQILGALVDTASTAGTLRYGPSARALATLFVCRSAERARIEGWRTQAESLGALRAAFGVVPAWASLIEAVASAIAAFTAGPLEGAMDAAVSRDAAEYLAESWTTPHEPFAVSAASERLRQRLLQWLDRKQQRDVQRVALEALRHDLPAQLALAQAWVAATSSDDAASGDADLGAVLEAAVWWMTESELDRRASATQVQRTLTAMRGQHPRVVDGALEFRLDAFLGRLGTYLREHVPAYRAYRALRQSVLAVERARLQLDALTPNVMSSFVRNRLIDASYLPLIGDNLAKQMGATGASKRTDLMGLLLLVSPPGYGKTTLMEYVAQRLGLIFVKVNGPALGHNVVSLDPAEAPNATARQEVEKVNFALEMGNNVMLYVDDIQHTHPEFLQKFISLCDATRRIEGVWRGATRTYDLRGKKFCVVMAGNPYTESGATFQIPDMLANRADIYNLGDVLSGKQDVFASSYIENALTSNRVLAPIAARGMDDVYRLIDMAAGRAVAANELEHALSSVEVDEAIRVLKHMMAAREVLLRVNAEYIRSAAQEDAYRQEPPFKLQGSYRNMNKIAEKIVPAMNDAELQALIDDHYVGEAQTLTTGAEQNLLKLHELRGTLDDEASARWVQIKREFVRRNAVAGDADDPVAQVTGALSGLSRGLDAIGDAVQRAADRPAPAPAALEQPQAPAPVIHVPQQAAPVIHVPQQAAPVIHVPQQAAPVIHVPAAPAPVLELAALVPLLERIAEGVTKPNAQQAIVDALRQIDLRLATARSPRPTREAQVAADAPPPVPRPTGAAASDDHARFAAAAAATSELGESLVPVMRSLGRQLDEGRAVNARMVELIDVLKLFIQHWSRRLDE